MEIKCLSNANGETTIVGSKFLYYSFFIKTEEEAQANLAALKKKHFDATHVCYAYIVSDNVFKFSDDGEPSSTAGQPILTVLKSGGYVKSLIAVVRYFGGTKLGVGGLVRAYTDSAKLAENLAEKLRFVCVEKFFFKLSFSDYKKLEKTPLLALLVKKEIVYSDCVEIMAFTATNDFSASLYALTLGKVTAEKQGEEFVLIK